MARGGYRKPEGGPRAPGVGKNSQRTDTQPINVPNVQDSEDLSHGDRQMLEQGQSIQRIGRQRTPQMAPGGGGGRVPPMGGGLPPDHLMGLPSTRPNEPETEGLALGPGAGPEVLAPQPQDDREVVLQWLASQPNAPQAIVDMQNDIRNARMAPAPMPQPQAVPESMAEEPMEGELPEEEVPAEEPSPIEAVEDDELEEEEPSPI